MELPLFSYPTDVVVVAPVPFIVIIVIVIVIVVVVPAILPDAPSSLQSHRTRRRCPGLLSSGTTILIGPSAFAPPRSRA